MISSDINTIISYSYIIDINNINYELATGYFRARLTRQINSVIVVETE
jgi:hypothetical protein